MRRKVFLLTVALMAVAAVGVVPAQASRKCTPRRADYDGKGTLVSGTLTRDSGKKKTYSGTLTVLVTKTNHNGRVDRGLTKTYTLSHARVHFGAGVNHTSPAPGSRVGVEGTITKLPRRCSTDGFTPSVTVKRVNIYAAKETK